MRPCLGRPGKLPAWMAGGRGIDLDTRSAQIRLDFPAKSYRMSLANESCSIPPASISVFVARAEGEASMSSLMLIGAIFASLALGVLMAYGICQALFRVFWMHAQSTQKRVRTASVRVNAGT